MLLFMCLVWLFDLTGSVKSSGRRRVFGRVVFLCCLCFFITSSSGSFSLGLRRKTLSPSQVFPLEGFAVLRVSLCRNPLGDRQVLKGVTQPNVTILTSSG